MEISILGAGNGGLAFGGTLIQQGATVKLFDKFHNILNPIINNNNYVTLKRNGRAENVRFHKVTHDLEAAIIDSKFIFVVTPAFAHKEIAGEIANFIKSDQVIILHPGRTGGALSVKKVLEEKGKSEITVVETETLLYACRKINATTVEIYGEKNKVGLASIPANAIHDVIKDISIYSPRFFPYSSVLFTSLNNIGSIFHPAPFLLNIGKVDRRENFKYYHEGISPFIASLLERIDKERVLIAEKFSIKIPSAKSWLEENYTIKGNSLYEVIQKNIYYENIFTPLDINSRYIFEDIPMSLYPLTELARVVSVETPHMDSIIDLACSIYNRDFREEGRNLMDMGLKKSNFSKEMKGIEYPV